jgi:ATP-dependent helicase HrpB
MVVRAADEGRARLAARLALLLSEQGLGGRDVDARTRLRRFAEEGGARARAARALADRIARAAGAPAGAGDDEEDAGRVLALAFPDRVARARAARSGDYLMVSGRAAAIEASDPLAREPYLVVADLAGRAERAAILLAAPIGAADIDAMFSASIVVRETVAFDAAAGAVRGRRARMLGKIALAEGPLDKPDPLQMEAALLEAVRADFSLLPWSEDELQLRARVALLAALEGGEWPDLGDEALHADLDAWLAPALAGAARLSDLAHGPLMRALEGRLGYKARARLEAQAPTRLSTPAGGSAAIDYRAPGGPSAAMRLQEMFGLGVHPSVAGGRAPLTLVLLSPAQRPIQTTRDLPGFWRGSYAGVRAEMRGRYPKHPWPEDPLRAEPTRRAKPRPERS